MLVIQKGLRHVIWQPYYMQNLVNRQYLWGSFLIAGWEDVLNSNSEDLICNQMENAQKILHRPVVGAQAGDHGFRVWARQYA